MKNQNNLYTLITGASSGLGKEFAIECASRKMNLILVSLPNENLGELSDVLVSKFQVQVYYREIDLTKKDAVEKLANWVTDNFSVDILINNAGVGGTCIFVDSSIEYLDNMIQLNIRAMTVLTRLLLPEMKKKSNAYVLNVSSLAAFTPLPYKSIYPASKAFIHHFTRGLKAELKESNIKVSVLSPGPIMTNADVSNRISGQSLYIRLSILTPERIARIAIKKLLRKKSVIIPGFMNRFSALLIQILPVSFRINVGTMIFKRDLRKKLSYDNRDRRDERSLLVTHDQTVATRKVGT